MCVCIHVRAIVRMYIREHASVCVCVCMGECMCVCVCVRMGECMCVCVCGCNQRHHETSFLQKVLEG